MPSVSNFRGVMGTDWGGYQASREDSGHRKQRLLFQTLGCELRETERWRAGKAGPRKDLVIILCETLEPVGGLMRRSQ